MNLSDRLLFPETSKIQSLVSSNLGWPDQNITCSHEREDGTSRNSTMPLRPSYFCVVTLTCSPSFLIVPFVRRTLFPRFPTCPTGTCHVSVPLIPFSLPIIRRVSKRTPPNSSTLKRFDTSIRWRTAPATQLPKNCRSSTPIVSEPHAPTCAGVLVKLIRSTANWNVNPTTWTCPH